MPASPAARPRPGRLPRVVDLDESSIDPALWGKNFPRAGTDGYKRTSERYGTKYGGGGSETLATEKLDTDPRLKTIFDGYAFALDYRNRRGHAYMLEDQRNTQAGHRAAPDRLLPALPRLHHRALP